MARSFAPTPSVDDVHRAVRDVFAKPAAKVARRDAADARAHHMRRQLEAAAEHGAALLSALDLPRLVTTGFVPVDRAVVGEAVDSAVAALDELDGDSDLEDDGAGEPSLASPERHPEVPEVTWGNVYTARGGSEGQLRWAEGARDDREMVDEDQAHDDDELDGAGEVDAEPSIGWPEDYTAEVVSTFSAEGDAEQDDCDLEDGDIDQDERDPWPALCADRPMVAHV